MKLNPRTLFQSTKSNKTVTATDNWVPLTRQCSVRDLFHRRDCNLGIRGTATRIVVMLVFAVMLGGCMSLKPVNLPGEEVREQVRAGKVVRPGQQVSITTEDGRTQKFEVKQVTDRAIQGNGANVSIDSIVSVRTRRIDGTRSALAVVGAVVAVYILAAVDAMNDIIDAIGE